MGKSVIILIASSETTLLKRMSARQLKSVDLHVDTFQPHNGTQTSVLFLQKKTVEQKAKELATGQMADYNIFMAMVERIGHDKRGNPLFKRDIEGNEILAPDTDTIILFLGNQK